MTLLHSLRLLARRAGLDVSRFRPDASTTARLGALLAHHRIDLVIDVGASDGEFARELRLAGFRGPIVSFEPLRAAHRELTANAGGDPDWRVAPRMALGERDCEATIHVAANSRSSSLLPMLLSHVEAAPDSSTVATEAVPLRRLDGVDHLFSGASRIYLKIDTQGYEAAVLAGAQGLLPRIAGIQVELSTVPLYEGQPLYGELLERLRGYGFELWGIAPGFFHPGHGRLLQFDGVFFREKSELPSVTRPAR